MFFGFVSNWVAENILKDDKPDFIITMTEDRYKLYEKAIKVGLIWPTGSIFNRTEIWTEKDKENWKNLKPEIQKIFEV